MPQGAFVVSATKVVYFSPGNLQYTTIGTHLCADGTSQRGTWRFAPNQYDIIGDGNKNISSSYTGWIDLFGWGTSGYNDKHPYMTSSTNSDYGDGNSDISGTNYDWGVYNTIGTDAPGTWRTLTMGEWNYLIGTRDNAKNRYGAAMVNGVNGIILLPDEWTLPDGLTFNAGMPAREGAEFYQTVNNYTLAQWQDMEVAGAVFLPLMGYRREVRYVGSDSYYYYYYTASSYSSDEDYSLFYFRSSLFNIIPSKKHYGKAVRLVKDIVEP